MQPIGALTAQQAQGVQFVLCDIDDTLTLAGKLTAEAYSALWALDGAGFSVIPVTGRPAGWCDLIVRQWPVAAVIGENGAFAYEIVDGKRRDFLHPEAAGDAKERLLALKEAVFASEPLARVACDQFARLYDIAFDFAEQEPALPMECAVRIRDLCLSMGARAKISSIHVNAWFGQYDKLDMALRFLVARFGVADARSACLFVGDSPNDEPMFSHFPLGIGVSNVMDFIKVGQMRALPAFVTAKRGGAGFAEAAEHLIRLKAK